MNFNTFSLHPEINKSIAKAGYVVPTQIQQATIPKILEGLDIKGSAQTGTGKTAAFLLPVLHLLSTKPPKKDHKGPRVLVLVPTRELGNQISTQSEKYSSYLPKIKTVFISGGIPYHKQLSKLSRSYDVLIATPGRLIDFMKQGKISLKDLETLILDEADQMLDMGFIPAVREIVAKTPHTRQTLLFSATMPNSIHRLSEEILKNPIDIIIENCSAKHENIDQRLQHVNNISEKNDLLDDILEDPELYKAIVFTSTRRQANRLVSELREKGQNVGVLHGEIDQRKRTRTIKSLRNGDINILVATDVAARGLDIDSITHVINFDFPQSSEDYVHRIGRTGRAGAKGVALSFVLDKDRALVREIEKLTKYSFDQSSFPKLAQEPRKKTAKKPYSKKAFSKARKPFSKSKNAPSGAKKKSFPKSGKVSSKAQATFPKTKSASSKTKKKPFSRPRKPSAKAGDALPKTKKRFFHKRRNSSGRPKQGSRGRNSTRS